MGSTPVVVVLEDSFVVPAVLSAFELYNYPDSTRGRCSAECRGGVWGRRDNEVWTAVYAATTQLIDYRDEDSSYGREPFDILTHGAWAGYDISGCNYLGAFHSHPYPDVEAGDGLIENWSEPSDDDEETMPREVIEIIVSLVPSSSVPHQSLEWAQRGDRVSGRVDVAYVTISGWYNDEDGLVDEVRVEWPGCAQRPFLEG